MKGLFEQEGARPQKEPRFTPLVIERSFTGLVTQRSYLHDPSDMVTQRFYGGRPDALWDGLNVELTNSLTLARRNGLSAFSTATYPTAPLSAFSFHLPDGTIQVLVDTASAVYWDEQNGSKTLIYTKQAGAGAARFVQSQDGPDGVAYIGDGISTLKYTPGNVNGLIWNWGIATPTAAPSVTTIQVGSSAPGWTASTVYSTMGLIVDSNNNIQSLNSVSLQGNTSQIGKSGTGQPPFSDTFGGTFTETSGAPITWQCNGEILQWQGGFFYANGACIYDPATNCVFVNLSSGGATSTTKKPTFNSQLGSVTGERSGGAGPNWGNIGYVGGNGASENCEVWLPSTDYTAWDTNKYARMVVLSPVLATPTNTSLSPATTQPVYVQLSTTTGVSGSGYTPAWAQSIGLPTVDGNLQWIDLGSKTWSSTATYIAWSPGQTVFSALVDSNNNMWVCVVGGTPGSSNPFTAASNVYGDTQNETGSPVVWKCVGPAMTWAANTKWFLPANGFAPPSQSQAFGGASITDSNQNVQYVTVSGLSGSTVPSPWSTATLQLNATPDNAAYWTMTGPYSANSMTWTKGHVYAISYKCRAVDDPYVTTGLLESTNLLPNGNPNDALLQTVIGNILGLTQPLGPYKGGGTGAVSSASPTFVITGASATSGVVNQITIQGSADPQVDTIVIWRDADGGGSSNMFELIEIPNPPIVNGTPGTAIFNDFLPDVPSTVNGVQYPGLNVLLPAPINGVNDPPVSGFQPHISSRFVRIWGVYGSTVAFSGGPDTRVGNPNEAFLIDDSFTYSSGAVRLVDTPPALLVFLTDSISSIQGGPITESFFPSTIAPGIGLGNFNGLDIHAGEIFFFSTDSQAYTMTPSLQLANMGFNIGDKLASFNSANAYLTFHQAGVDSAVYIGDGSTGWYRCNPHQVPQQDIVWSPKATVAAGAQMLQSVEISPGVFKLLVGGTGTNQQILQRDPTVFTDNGSSFDAFAWIGALWLARSGQIAAVAFVEADFTGVGSTPVTVSLLLDEISGTFFSLPNYISDPPLVYGAAGAPSSLQMNRYYLNQTQDVARCKFLGIKVDFGADTTQTTLHDFTVYGALFVER